MSWKETIFKLFIQLQRGYDLPRSQMKDGPYPVVGSNCIIGYHNEFKLEPPGVITGRSGTLGKVQFITTNYWPHNTALWVRDFKNNDPKFVYYKLQTLNLEKYNAGGAVPTLNRNNLDNIPVRIPLLPIQRKIASILSAYDYLIENNLRRIALLEESAKLLYREWFVRFRFPGHEHTRIINGVPEGWEKKKISDVCETVGGGTPSTQKPEYWEGGDITWVIPTDITRNNCLVLLDSEKKITEEGLKNSSARLVPLETILMTSRASVGFFGLIDREVCTNQGFISIITHQEHYRMYLLHNFITRREEILSKAGGTTYKEITKRTFRSFDILMPSKALLEEFQVFAYDTIRQTRVLKKQIEKLIQARDLLLPKLMSGEIVV